MNTYRGRTLVFVTTVVVVVLGVVALAVAAIGDTAPPVTTDDYDGLWHSTDVNVMLRATDQASGVAGTYFSWSAPDYVSGTFATLVAKRDHSNDGIHTLTYYSEDAVGNREKPKSRVVKIDTRAPVTTVSGQDKLWHRTSVVLTFSADDRGGAGIALTQYRIDRKAWKNGTTAIVKAPRNHRWDGKHTVRFRSRDAAGNVETTRKVIVRIDTRGRHGVTTPAASAASGAYATWRPRAGEVTRSTAKVAITGRTSSGKGAKTGSPPKEPAKEAVPPAPGAEDGSDSWTRERSRRACGPSGGQRRARSAAPASARSWSRSAGARADGAPRSTGRRASVTQRSAQRGDPCGRSGGDSRSEMRGKRTRTR